MLARFICLLALFLVAKSANITVHDDNIDDETDKAGIDAALPVEEECALYLAPSAISGHGRAIVAGKFIPKGQAIDRVVTLAMKYDDIKDTQLNNYVFGTNEEDITMTEFGVGMLYNHNKSPGVHHNWDTEIVAKASDQQLAHTSFTTVTATSSKDHVGTVLKSLHLTPVVRLSSEK